ncbi:rRNA maturation RNase YbeY [Candidatus Cloacimonadota bacterium]|jgi:probable rRNA maturation factor|nr:rRNA maturation RNase YbeY [Candidatus Cloacimonadota bacterium]MDD3235928.1 rRNA maturation RNase YbeY [Candidatus Cloacimonadota bacterium]
MTELDIIGNSPLKESVISDIASLICEREDPVNDYLICIKFLESKEMQHYNRVYRGVNQTTDILSFENADIPLELTNECLAAGSEKKRNFRLCDILIDINQLIEQKGEKTLEEEFRIVLIHGLLHLVGYDHIRNQDAFEMKTKENLYLNEIQGDKISG